MYIYGMRARGFSIWCQPEDGLLGLADDRHNNGKYYDVIAYDIKLSYDECRDYQLDFLGKENGENE